MLDKIKGLFGRSEEPEGEEIDAQTAAAALMVETALADGVYANVEETRIKQALMAAFDLDEAAVAELLVRAEPLAEHAVDHHRFTNKVKALPKETRLALMEHLFAIALADGENDAHEDSLLRRLGPLLAVSDRERADARARAKARADARDASAS